MSHNHYLSPLVFLCFSFPILFPYANAFNITSILNQYPDFATFNNLLTQSQLVSTINSRQTITVLVVENGNMAPLNGKPADYIKKALSVQIILDYYDVQKLQKMSNKTAILTTLFQASGQATGQQGFLNVTILGTQSVAFGSAVPGSNLNSNLVKSVFTQPYNISVLQVSNVIVPPGINTSPSTPANGNNNSSSNSTTSPPPSSSSSVPPPSSAPKSAPTNATSPPSPSSKAPTPSKTATPPPRKFSPKESPKASPPGPAGVAPVADGPTSDDSPPENAAAKSNAGTWVSLFVMSLSLVYWIV